MAIAFGDAQDVFDAANQHGVALVEVELEITQQHDVSWAGVGEHAIEQLEGIQRIGTCGDAPFLHIDQALGGGPGVKVAFERSADRSDFGFGVGFFGCDNGEAGIACLEIGG